jgi:hypothetical protein
VSDDSPAWGWTRLSPDVSVYVDWATSRVVGRVYERSVNSNEWAAQIEGRLIGSFVGVEHAMTALEKDFHDTTMSAMWRAK